MLYFTSFSKIENMNKFYILFSLICKRIAFISNWNYENIEIYDEKNKT